MNDSEQILQAITALSEKVERSIDAVDKLRAQLEETRHEQKQHSAAIADMDKRQAAMDKRQAAQDANIDKIQEVINELVHSNALIRRTESTAVLKKEPLYDRFSKLGYGRNAALKELYRNGLLIKPKCGGKSTTVIKFPSGSTCYRAVVININ